MNLNEGNVYARDCVSESIAVVSQGARVDYNSVENAEGIVDSVDKVALVVALIYLSLEALALSLCDNLG